MTNLAQPSPWLAELMGLFLWPLITILPAGLVSHSFHSLPCQLHNEHEEAHETPLNK
jgi:hypothetical protein